MLAIGIALGLAFNGLARAGRPQRGLPWIAEATALETLEQVRSATPVSPPRPAAPVSDDPLAMTGGGSGVPEIPDVGRPIQIGLEAVRSFFDARAALFVDSRDAADYAAGHVPGALNLPFEESVTDPARLEAVDSRGRPIIVYCGGDGCEVSIQLAGALMQAGHRKVLVYEGGYPEWESMRYPIEKGDGGREAGR
jgi:rhodanese-related sulfurtransferase